MINSIKLIRQRSGAPISLCQEALTNTGSVEGALEFMRLKGIHVAEKFASRTAVHGLVSLAVTDRFGAIVKIGCETDFAALSDPVISLAQNLPKLLSPKTRGFESASFKTPIHSQIRSLLVQDAFAEVSALIGEKVEIKSVDLLEADFVGGYVHSTVGANLGKRGALVGFNGTAPPGFESFSRSVARHIVACPPKFVSLTLTEPEKLRVEMDVVRSGCQDEHAFAKKWKRFIEDNILEEARFVSDSDSEVTVKDALEEFVVRAGGAPGSVYLSSFVTTG